MRQHLWMWAFVIPFRPNGTIFGPGDVRLCGNCQHAILSTLPATCRLFGTIEPVTGAVHHHACASVRADESCCGRDARYFMQQIPFTTSSDSDSD